MKDKIKSLPIWARKFVTDSVEGFVGAALALTIVGSVDAIGKALAVAAGVAALAAARRNAPDFYAWLKDLFSTND